jgi:hypothetical protein
MGWIAFAIVVAGIFIGVALEEVARSLKAGLTDMRSSLAYSKSESIERAPTRKPQVPCKNGGSADPCEDVSYTNSAR